MTPDDLVTLRHLVDRYADAVDSRDGVRLRGLFTEDGVLRVQADGSAVENEWSGDDVVRSFDALSTFHRTFHHVGGCVFEDGSDGPVGRVHCVAHHYERTTNGPVDLVMMITYHDRYVQESGEWRIAARRVSIEWTELHPAHPKRRTVRL